jgi:hypothetical protein
MRLLALAGDAGGAHALAPVIKKLKKMSGVGVDCRAYAAALVLWEKESLAPVQISGMPEDPYDAFLLGTSVQPECWELKLVEHARSRSIRTICMMDSWENYWKRFTGPVGQRILPDRIAVTDEKVKAEMEKSNFPADRLFITGNPAFEGLRSFSTPAKKRESRRRLATKIGLAWNTLIFLYVSQPLSQLWDRAVLGFLENEVSDTVVLAIDRLLKIHDCRGCLVYLLHPRERGVVPCLPAIDGSRLGIHVWNGTDVDSREIIMGCDLVIGMNSIMLMEACLLGKTVISYLPGIRIPDTLPCNRFGWSRPAYAKEDLESSLESEIYSDTAKERRQEILKGITPYEGATDKVIELIVKN